MEKKRITFSVGPSVILLAVLVLCIVVVIFLLRGKGEKAPRTLTIDDTPVIATRIRTLGELTTACFYDEMVLSAAKANHFSVSPLGSIARQGLGKDVDDHLVIIARGTVRAGIDFRALSPGSIEVSGDTVVVWLPEPKYLDIIVNPSNMEVFAESGKWSQKQVSMLQDGARTRLIREADHAQLKDTAYDGAVAAVTDLLTACGYPYVRVEREPLVLPLPRE